MEHKHLCNMIDSELEEFENNLTFDILQSIDDDEFDMLDPDVVQEVVNAHDFDDIEDSIYWKEEYGIELNPDEEYHLDWSNKINSDPGLKIDVDNTQYLSDI